MISLLKEEDTLKSTQVHAHMHQIYLITRHKLTTEAMSSDGERYPLKMTAETVEDTETPQ